jgi:hypothetical protein
MRQPKRDRLLLHFHPAIPQNTWQKTFKTSTVFITFQLGSIDSLRSASIARAPLQKDVDSHEKKTTNIGELFFNPYRLAFADRLQYLGVSASMSIISPSNIYGCPAGLLGKNSILSTSTNEQTRQIDPFHPDIERLLCDWDYRP